MYNLDTTNEWATLKNNDDAANAALPHHMVDVKTGYW